ncbi:hypothetical protein JB92DRAFT_3124658 [Gautieria morchelliformis]|nr:hypothetical protein JB92DRAFT_3124658 [Gautieria morchelliformis]
MITRKGLHIEHPMGLGMGNTVSQGLDVSSQPAAAKTRPSGTLAHEGTDAQAVLELKESRTRWEKAADARKHKHRMEEHGFVDHPHKCHARLPRTASKPEEALEEPAGGIDSDVEDHVQAKEAWMKLLSCQLRHLQSIPTKGYVVSAPSDNPNMAALQFTSSLIAPAQTSSINTNETFTSSLIAAPEKPCAQMCHTPNVGPLQPIGNFQANGTLQSHPSQRTESMIPQGALQPALRHQPLTTTRLSKQVVHGTGNSPHTSSTDLLRSSSPLSFQSHSHSSKYPSGSSSLEGTGMPASPKSVGGQPSCLSPVSFAELEDRVQTPLQDKNYRFCPEFHSTIHLACWYYRVILCTHELFPLENEQDRYLREAWQLACAEHEVNLKANRDVLNLVRSFGLFFPH